MAYADKIFKDNLRNVLENGVWDTGYEVRPKWSDGVSAHTKYVTMVSNVYDIAKEGIPITTLRKVAWKTAIKEMLWIWLDKSNDVDLLEDKYNVRYWREWANEFGNLGTSYAYQLAKVIDFPEGRFDQVNRLLHLLKNDPMNRRIQTEMFNLEEMSEMMLPPCAHSTKWVVRGKYLDLNLIQRSQDMVAANSINVFGYAVLLCMVAQVTGYLPGILKHDIADMHIYDRHLDIARDLLLREEYPAPKLWIDPAITDFYDFKPEHFKLINYQHGEQVKMIPIAI